MSTLKERILKKYKENRVEDFKNKHPEVYDWFNSDYFIDTMAISGNLSIPWEFDQTLPRYDSSGEVNIYEVRIYLVAEGFKTNIDFDEDYTILEITLK